MRFLQSSRNMEGLAGVVRASESNCEPSAGLRRVSEDERRFHAGSENNQAVVQYLATAALPEQLAELYGEALRVRLKLCVADFFVTLAEVPNCWVEVRAHVRVQARATTGLRNCTHCTRSSRFV